MPLSNREAALPSGCNEGAIEQWCNDRAISILGDESFQRQSVPKFGLPITGIGITADFLPLVFDRLSQAEGVMSVKGLGLELAVAIVQMSNSAI